jgi:hypothetical protein
LILLAYFYAQLPAASAALLLAATAAAGGRLSRAWPISRLSQMIFRAAICLVPLVIAVALAARAMLVARGTDGY